MKERAAGKKLWLRYINHDDCYCEECERVSLVTEGLEHRRIFQPFMKEIIVHNPRAPVEVRKLIATTFGTRNHRPTWLPWRLLLPALTMFMLMRDFFQEFPKINALDFTGEEQVKRKNLKRVQVAQNWTCACANETKTNDAKLNVSCEKHFRDWKCPSLWSTCCFPLSRPSL